MNANEIMQHDMLDILFENKNKSYGAYELRRQYARRLKKALGIVCFSLLAIFTMSFAWKGKQVVGPVDEKKEVTLKDYGRKKEEIEIVKPKPSVQQQHASQQFTAPLIVQATVPLEEALPEMDQLDNVIISTDTRPGDETDGTLMPETSTSGEGGGVGSLKPKDDPIDEGPMWHVQIMPEFPGGQDALMRFLGRHLKAPRDLENGEKVVVQAQFVVDFDGSITHSNITKTGGGEFDEEVLRVLKLMPKWNPGQQNGKSVQVYFTLPVTFVGEGE
jgi:periplasmic protein TonB